MSTNISPGKLLTLVLALASLCTVAQADTFSSVVVYGDSLSDNGNLFTASGGIFPPPPYFDGRLSNGPLAVEQLAAALGIPLADFAWIGATTGIGNISDGGTPTSTGIFGLPGMQAELAGTPAAIFTPGLVGTELFVVWGGADNFLTPSPNINQSVGDIVGIVNTLIVLGAQHILVPGMPDLGLTPSFEALGPVAAAQATLFSNLFNAALAASLPAGATFFDTAALMRGIVGDPGAYGLSNVTDPCFNGVTVCANPDQYLFWDDFHPTTAANAIAAKAFASDVPEPSSVVLLLTACALGIGSRKRLFARR
jgi:cholinesterase